MGAPGVIGSPELFLVAVSSSASAPYPSPSAPYPSQKLSQLATVACFEEGVKAIVAMTFPEVIQARLGLTSTKPR